MTSPIDIIKGQIVDVDQHGNLTIKAYYPDWKTLVRRKYKDCNIQLIDGRKLSDKQRRMCYALLRAISDYTGQGLTSTKEHMKKMFMSEELGKPTEETFSLSDTSVSMACAFQRYLIKFILEFDIPCSMPLMDYVDDVQSYVYACATAKKCCVCGKQAKFHRHSEISVGIGGGETVWEGVLMEPLCDIHNKECNTISQKDFDEKYHIAPVDLDKNLLRIWFPNQEE